MNKPLFFKLLLDPKVEKIEEQISDLSNGQLGAINCEIRTYPTKISERLQERTRGHFNHLLHHQF